jgi:arylsulfatase A-like enzyme
MGAMRMTRRKAMITGLGGAAVLRGQGRSALRRQPNVVFILADDLGYADLSCYGRREYKTPQIDRLAGQGARLVQAYANSSVCTATRVALATGRYQYRLPVGLEEPLATGGDRSKFIGLPPDHPTLASLLKKAGYQTALVGKWHLGMLPKFGPLQSGYEHFWGLRTGGVDYFSHLANATNPDSNDLWEGDTNVKETGYLTDLLGNHAIDAINRFAAARRPFLLSLHFTAPHWPWEGPQDEAESKRLRSLFHYDGGSMKTYAEMVTRLDDQVGRVLAAIERAGIAGNTIVVFTSDNGGERFGNVWPFTGNKEQLLEGGIRVPAIVRWPGKVKAGSELQQVAMTMDWIPTFLAAGAASADPAYPLDGMDLTSALGGAKPVSRQLYWRFKYNQQRAVRDGDMKYLEIAGNTFLYNVAADPMERQI